MGLALPIELFIESFPFANLQRRVHKPLNEAEADGRRPCSCVVWPRYHAPNRFPG